MTSRIPGHFNPSVQNKLGDDVARQRRATGAPPSPAEGPDGVFEAGEEDLQPDLHERGRIEATSARKQPTVAVASSPEPVSTWPPILSAPFRLFVLAALANNRFWMAWLAQARG
jgi:hypothetical protein